ncbi:MAG: hypothetical protein ACLFSM_08160 [Thermoplasmata archaeon]
MDLVDIIRNNLFAIAISSVVILYILFEYLSGRDDRGLAICGLIFLAIIFITNLFLKIVGYKSKTEDMDDADQIMGRAGR